MGQYYKVAFRHNCDTKVTVNDRKVKGVEYILAKLLEHGYVYTHLCVAVAREMLDNPAHLAWVGDYAEEDELKRISNGEFGYESVWDTEHDHTFPPPKTESGFYAGKYLLNHTKGQYISFDDYFDALNEQSPWIVCPFAILTAVGNGRGGGDYRGVNEDLAGAWAWDELEITGNKEKFSGYEKVNPIFEIGF
jgi:hypothetical protein